MGKCPIELDGIKYGNTDTQYQMAEDFRDCSNMCLNKCYVSILTYIDNLTCHPQAEIICKPTNEVIKPSVSNKIVQPSNCKQTSEVVTHTNQQKMKPSVSNANEITGKNVIIIQGANSTTFTIN